MPSRKLTSINCKASAATSNNITKSGAGKGPITPACRPAPLHLGDLPTHGLHMGGVHFCANGRGCGTINLSTPDHSNYRRQATYLTTQNQTQSTARRGEKLIGAPQAPLNHTTTESLSIANLARILSVELDLGSGPIARTIGLLDEGNTIPFIARYRKEITGSLDEIKIQTIADRTAALRALHERKADVRRLIDAQGKLTADLAASIMAAATLQEVE